MKAPVTFLLAAVLTASAQQAPKVNRIPPPGIEVPAADRTEIEEGVKNLGNAITLLKKKPELAGEIPNVEIFHKSADWALRYNEIFDAKQIATAKDHIKQGLERASALAGGDSPWNKQTGLVVRAYRSKIDGSVQPYGLVIPADWKPDDGKQRRLDFWCHGRGEKLSELAFIADRQKSPGEFVPEGAIVCHLYGRYCNANKFAGETDLFEALDEIKKHYPIDERRLVIRGFSMGGAACWQFATHFPGMWAAAAPGAGFAETAEFFKVFAAGKEAPPAWEQKLWRWYDCTTMAANLANTAVVAYSGEIDGQKQAADIMVKYAAREGITFPHIIGAKMGHKYDDASKAEINKLVDAAAAKSRDPFPKKVRIVTYSLIYPSASWVKIHRLKKHWEKAELEASYEDGTVDVKTHNIEEVSLEFFPQTDPPHDNVIPVGKVTVNGRVIVDKDTQFGAQTVMGKDFSGVTLFLGDDGFWAIKDVSYGLHLQGFRKLFRFSGAPEIAKNTETCGPIDHAFMSRFIFVRPTGKPLNDEIGAWAKAEMEHAIAGWRSVFRGDVTVVDDTAVTDALANDANLVAWGDVSSNKYLATIAAKLPLKWDATTLALGTQKVDATHHAPILIYPNPLNPSRYIVLNSGPTFREAAALNNSDQTPKLPDWAIVDITTPPGPKWPGQIVDAGFFDESWK